MIVVPVRYPVVLCYSILNFVESNTARRRVRYWYRHQRRAYWYVHAQANTPRKLSTATTTHSPRHGPRARRSTGAPAQLRPAPAGRLRAAAAPAALCPPGAACTSAPACSSTTSPPLHTAATATRWATAAVAVAGPSSAGPRACPAASFSRTNGWWSTDSKLTTGCSRRCCSRHRGTANRNPPAPALGIRQPRHPPRRTLP